MRSVVVYCPNLDCRKPLIRDARLRINTSFSVQCYKCGGIVWISASPEGINRKLVSEEKPSKLRPETPEPKDQDGLFGMVA